jgi:hypothetical protein
MLGALVRQSQQVYNREGTVPALPGLIDRIEAAPDAPFVPPNPPRRP